MTKIIKLSSVEDGLLFNKICCAAPFEIDITSGRYVIDAKSLLGLFSMDLTNNLGVVLHSNDVDEMQDFLDRIKRWVVE